MCAIQIAPKPYCNWITGKKAGCEENVNSLDKEMGGRLFYLHLA
jgi:hypothetical protein